MIDRRATVMLAAALLLSGIAATDAQTPPTIGMQTDETVVVFTLHWFTEMMAGRIDRAQYATAYSAQLTDLAVKQMSEALNKYGAAPNGAQILKKRSTASETFYLVKFLFPRGDAASMLFGFDTAGKITGIAVSSLAGD